MHWWSWELLCLPSMWWGLVAFFNSLMATASRISATILSWESVRQWICTGIVMQVITHNSCYHILCWSITHVHMHVKALFSDEVNTIGPPVLTFVDLPDWWSWSAVRGMLYLYATRCMLELCLTWTKALLRSFVAYGFCDNFMRLFFNTTSLFTNLIISMPIT